MLVQLHVKNLALIEETEVEFRKGLNILTGETGAGKSILLGSMQLILGQKAQKNLIRENASYGLAELLFQVEDTDTEKALEAVGIVPEDGCVLLSRRITEGRSISKINGEMCTLSQLRTAASCLLDIHGQHEHQSLLHREKQLEILDAYGSGETETLLAQTEEAFRRWSALKKELSAMDMDEEKRARETAFLEFEIGEISSAHLTPGEDEELEKRYRKLSNSRRIAEVLSEVHSLTGTETGAGDMTGSALRDLQRITEYDEELDRLYVSLNEADSLLNDFNREIASYLEDLTFDEEAFAETEQRLDLLNGLKAKYGQSVERILAYQEEQQKKLDLLTDYDNRLAALRKQTEDAMDTLLSACGKLSDCRKKLAAVLSERIVEGLRDLNFLDVRFRIRFDRRKSCTASGFDDIEYEISTNPGEKLRPLGEIVSGGELSRIMLAVKAILADKDRIGTLIFDEIDSGISGRTAQMVSEKMASIARHRQVICITHLPQIAAMADCHFEIEKHGDEENGTETQIHVLNREEQIRELARLLGGAKITDAVMTNAEEMKRLADERKAAENKA